MTRARAVTTPGSRGAPTPGGIEAVLDGLRAAGSLAGDVAADLVEPDAVARVIDAAVRPLGHLDVLVCNHARSNPYRTGDQLRKRLPAVGTRPGLTTARAESS